MSLQQEFEGMLAAAGIQGPTLNYIEHPTKRFIYAWNTQPLTPSKATGGKRWAAMMYKNKGGAWVPVRQVFFTTRKSAKNHAYRWHKNALARIELRKKAAQGA